MKFPWITLGQTNVAPDALLGLDVQIDDNDLGGNRDAELQWHDSKDKDYQNPIAFGTAGLAPAP